MLKMKEPPGICMKTQDARQYGRQLVGPLGLKCIIFAKMDDNPSVFLAENAPLMR